MAPAGVAEGVSSPGGRGRGAFRSCHPCRNLLRTVALAGMSAALIAPTAVARAEPSPAELTRRIETSSTELERVVESYNKLREEIKTNEAAVARLQTRIGPLEQQAEQSRADVGELAVHRVQDRRPAHRGRPAACRAAPTALLDRLGTLDQLTRQRQETHLRLHRRPAAAARREDPAGRHAGPAGRTGP